MSDFNQLLRRAAERGRFTIPTEHAEAPPSLEPLPTGSFDGGVRPMPTIVDPSRHMNALLRGALAKRDERRAHYVNNADARFGRGFWRNVQPRAADPSPTSLCAGQVATGLPEDGIASALLSTLQDDRQDRNRNAHDDAVGRGPETEALGPALGAQGRSARASHYSCRT